MRRLLGRVRRALFPARSHTFIWNRWRRRYPRQRRIVRALLLPVIKIGLWAGFTNVDYSYVHGELKRLHVGRDCSIMDTTFNLISGHVYIGDDTLFSHGCYVLTGQHRFYEGRRVNLHGNAPYPEVPNEGRDIHIGRGCFIGANATILGGVTLGDNVIVGAGAVVASDVPDGSFVAGIPARFVKAS